MSKPQRLLVSASLLTVAGLISRFIGFFYRIFLSHTIGAEGMGIYQLILPVCTLAYAFTVMGIQTALSKTISEHLSVNDRHSAWNIFFYGSILSFSLSIIVGIILFICCDWICFALLSQPACVPLVQFMAVSIPVGTLHICSISWYFANRNTWIPAIAQLLEQVIRMITSWLCYLVIRSLSFTPSPLLAMTGMVTGEFISLCFVFHFLKKEFIRDIGSFSNLKFHTDEIKKLLFLSIPLTVNRVITNLMRSIETILIPLCLLRFGMTQIESLSTYGIFTGMALPLILFPSAITQSFSVMLLPKIAEANARKNQQIIKDTVEKTIRYGLFLGILCFGIFYHCGTDFGILFYHCQEAGTYIGILAFLCPFLYLSSALSSIINGIGKTKFYFFQTIFGLSLRIIFVLCFIPRFGIVGYLWGILGNELLLVLLSIFILYRESLLSISLLDSFFKPMCFLLIASGCALFLNSLIICFQLSNIITLILYCFTTSCLYFYLLWLFHLIHLPKMFLHPHFFVDKK